MLTEFFSYVFRNSPTFKSATAVGVKIKLNVKVRRNGVWEEHYESVTQPSTIKQLLMEHWPDKCVVRTTYKGQEIERASF
jgi:hypothetical protein